MALEFGILGLSNSCRHRNMGRYTNYSQRRYRFPAVTDAAFYRWATASVLGVSLITNAKPAGVADETAMLTMRNTLIYISAVRKMIPAARPQACCHRVLAWEGSRGSESAPHEPLELPELPRSPMTWRQRYLFSSDPPSSLKICAVMSPISANLRANNCQL